MPESPDHSYDRLFCNDLALVAPPATGTAADWQRVLCSNPDASTVAALAENPAQTSRVRLLAYHWLKLHGQKVPKGTMLGVVVEVPFREGLDALAAYADGSIHYLNHSGSSIIVERAFGELLDKLRALLSASQRVVHVIGPWEKPRRPPPTLGTLRLSFLVSDGLYFGEGPSANMERDPMAGPIVSHASQLLQLLVASL